MGRGDVALTKHIGEHHLFEVAFLGTLESSCSLYAKFWSFKKRLDVTLIGKYAIANCTLILSMH
jgi:hypothetical protein